MLVKRLIKFGVALLILLTCFSGALDLTGCRVSAQTGYVSYVDEARVLYELGLYKGVSQTHFVPDLDAFSDKETALVFLLRLACESGDVLGTDDYVTNSTLDDYSDGDTVSDWARKYMAYGIRNNLIPNLDDNQIAPKRLVDGKTFTAILLKSIGYKLDGDMWEISTYINSYLGGISPDEAKELADKILTKNDMIKIVWKSFPIRTSGGISFLDCIIDNNDLRKSELVDLGFEYSGSTVSPPVFQKSDTDIDNSQNNGYSMRDGSIFYGESIDGVPNGYGMIHYDDGSVYEGYVVNGVREGEGKLERSDGFVYSGSWKDDKMTGYGTLKWPNGDSYTGYLYWGYFEGKGTMVWASGDNYTGDWIEGRFQGWGRFNWANGNYYEGEWYMGEFHGYGVLSMRNVGVYEGQWNMGKKQGQGKFVYIDNTVLEGTWDNDAFIGP